jgi:lipopolysaccharide assembly outer membrane protein LptD (OstA)
MHYDGNGHKVWTVDANTLSFDEDNQRTLANEVEVSFWSESNTDDAPQLIVITPQLNFSHLNRDLTFENGLEAHSTQGLKFRTDKAQWSDSAQVLEGKGNVRVEQTDALGGTVVLEGDTIRYDTNTGTFLLNADAESDSNVQLRIKPEEAETP